MELVQLVLDELALRGRCLSALHSKLGVGRPLELLERVVLKDPTTQAHYTGRVVDKRRQGNDFEYQFQVGLRLPDHLAAAKADLKTR